MAVLPKSYKKNGYTYTESSPGSNKFQNFTAAKPTVKDVRVASNANKAKAAVVTPKAKGKPGESNMSRSEATRPASRMGGMDTGNVMKSRPSATSSSDYRGTPVRGTPAKSSASTNNLAAEYNAEQIAKYKRGEFNAPTKPNTPAVKSSSGKGLLDKIVDRVTQPPKKLNAASVKMLNEARAEITPVVTALAGAGIVKKFGKDLIKAFTKKPKVNTDSVGRPVEELFKRGKGTPRVKPAPSRPFPKGKGTYRGKRTPGTYTQFGD